MTDELDDAELARRRDEQRRKLAEREPSLFTTTPQAPAVLPALPAFTLPPSPDEVEDFRERAAAREQQIEQGSAAAWRQVPRGMRAHENTLIERCSVELRRALQKGPNPTLSALLLGPTGKGKTSAAAYLVRRALNEYRHSNGERFAAIAGLTWIYAPDLITAEKEYPLGQGKSPLITSAFNATALVLDDVGAACCIQLFVDILTKRYHQGDRPLIVTSGLTQRELTTHLHAAGLRKITHQPSPLPVLCIDLHPADADKPNAKR